MDERLRRGLDALDAIHDRDPRRVEREGRSIAYARLYAEALTRWLERVAPDAHLALRLAVRAQHLGRFERPRDAYPMDRDGYRRWRRDAAAHHAELADAALRDAGFDGATRARIGALIRKEKLKVDPDAQRLEDAACLAFLELEFEDFAAKHDAEKVRAIVQKTWKKMSPTGHDLALAMPMSAKARATIEAALAGA